MCLYIHMSIYVLYFLWKEGPPQLRRFHSAQSVSALNPCVVRENTVSESKKWSLWDNKIEKCHRNCQVDVIIGICKILFECEFWPASTTIYKRKENNNG